MARVSNYEQRVSCHIFFFPLVPTLCVGTHCLRGSASFRLLTLDSCLLTLLIDSLPLRLLHPLQRLTLRADIPLFLLPGMFTRQPLLSRPHQSSTTCGPNRTSSIHRIDCPARGNNCNTSASIARASSNSSQAKPVRLRTNLRWCRFLLIILHFHCLTQYPLPGRRRPTLPQAGGYFEEATQCPTFKRHSVVEPTMGDNPKHPPSGRVASYRAGRAIVAFCSAKVALLSLQRKATSQRR